MDIGENEAMMLRSINNKRIGRSKDLSLITWRATKLKGGGESQILRICWNYCIKNGINLLLKLEV